MAWIQAESVTRQVKRQVMQFGSAFPKRHMPASDVMPFCDIVAAGLNDG